MLLGSIPRKGLDAAVGTSAALSADHAAGRLRQPVDRAGVGEVRRLALEGRAVRRTAKPLNAATSRRPGRQGAGAGGHPARSRSAVYGASAARIAATAWAMAARGAGVG